MDTLAKVGQAVAVWKAIIATVVAVPLAAVGLFLIVRRRHRTHWVMGTVVGASVCHNGRCTLDYRFSVDGKGETIITKTADPAPTPLPAANAPVKVWYNPADPQGSANLRSDDWRIPGAIMLGFAVLICGSAWFWYWLTRRYQVAAVYGAVGGVVQ